MKKITALLLALLMVFCITTPVHASTGNETSYKEKYEQMISLTKKLMKKPVLELEKNSMTYDGYRHIKIDWDDVGAQKYIIQIADNARFKNAKEYNRLSIKGSYYNFSELEDSEANYYIRIRPIFVLGKYNDNYIYSFGRWSNTVYAEYVPFDWDNADIPDIDLGIPEVPTIDTDKIKVPDIKIELNK